MTWSLHSVRLYPTRRPWCLMCLHTCDCLWGEPFFLSGWYQGLAASRNATSVGLCTTLAVNVVSLCWLALAPAASKQVILLCIAIAAASFKQQPHPRIYLLRNGNIMSSTVDLTGWHGHYTVAIFIQANLFVGFHVFIYVCPCCWERTNISVWLAPRSHCQRRCNNHWTMYHPCSWSVFLIWIMMAPMASTYVKNKYYCYCYCYYYQSMFIFERYCASCYVC